MTHVAIVGSGQLARMMALAGWPLGVKFSFLAFDDESSACVDGLGSVVRVASTVTAEDAFARLGEPDIVTVEREDVPVPLLQGLQSLCSVFPPPEAVLACQNRASERELLSSLKIPVAPYTVVTSVAEGRAAVDTLGYPCVFKRTESGYDGRGQWWMRSEDDVRQWSESWDGWPVLAEAAIAFDREVSLVAARSASGEIVCYPLTENAHDQGILRSSLAPASDPDQVLAGQAAQMMQALLNALNYVGVLTIECFVVDGGVLVNELAPRVHNSGHWTQVAPVASQFENHVRALIGAPLGRTELEGFSGMVNILGGEQPPELLPLLSSCSQVALYNKSYRPRRKLGHVGVWDSSQEAVVGEMRRLDDLLFPELSG